MRFQSLKSMFLSSSIQDLHQVLSTQTQKEKKKHTPLYTKKLKMNIRMSQY